jgi:hypothetical protein
MQNVWQYHFPEPGGGGCCGTNWPTEVVEIAKRMNLMKMIDSSLPPVTHTWVEFSDVFYTFYHKKDTNDGF